MENVIKELEKMEKDGVETLEIYYAEEIEEGSENWSVDVMNDELNNLCDMQWTWTILYIDEVLDVLNDLEWEPYICNDWEIIVNKPFSEEIVVKCIETWLNYYNINIKVKIIDIKDAEGSGYIKTLKDRIGKLT